jgi:hypothetical protein
LRTSCQLEAAIPPSTTAAISSGEFVGMVADNPDQQMPLKTFHSKLMNQVKDKEAFPELPILREVNQTLIYEQYHQIKKDIEQLVYKEIQLILDSSDSSDLLNT